MAAATLRLDGRQRQPRRVFALCLLLRHLETLPSALLHKAALVSLFDGPARVRDNLTGLILDGMTGGGLPLALERFVRFVAGDANWGELQPRLRQRVQSPRSQTRFASSSSATLPAPSRPPGHRA
jgi:hypothetical protein